MITNMPGTHPLQIAAQKLNDLLPQTRLKEHQLSVLDALARQQNVFASLPTGYGKSLCYWLPAAAWNWKVWVVSPLISLMEDQVSACRALGIPALAIHSGNALTESEIGAAQGRILFLSPERLGQWWESGMLTRLQAQGLAPQLLVLDEMHCFEEWRKFRVGYQEIFAPIRKFTQSGGQLLGLSASFSRESSDQWMKEFCDQYERVDGELGRANLSLNVVPVENDYWRWLLLVSFLRNLHAPESALVYCSSRSECDQLSGWLASAGFPVASYHAGLPSMVRRERSRAFRAGHLRIVCATSAFGMGIDYPHVGRVFHFSTPYDLESYWQEVGRAGRSGRDAICVAAWRRSDVARAQGMEPEQRARFLALWQAWFSGVCRKQAVAQRFGLEAEACGKCDRCRSKNIPAPLHDWEILLRNRVWWTEPAAEPLRWLEKNFARGKALDQVPNPDSVLEIQNARESR